jgi:hypothetical protein
MAHLFDSLVRPPIFHLRSAQVKMQKPVLCCGFRSVLIENHVVEKSKVSVYTENVIFSNVVAFTGTIRKFLNMVAVHIEGRRHPPICLFSTLFSRVIAP